jgi:hypothetical protein
VRDARRRSTRAERPHGAYPALIAAFHALFLLFLAGMRRAGRPLPERVEARDVVLVGAATQQLSRVLTRDTITTVVRAPFTTVEGPAVAPGELAEAAVGSGWRRAVGELLTCPYCNSAWIASALTCGLAAAPRQTRLVSAVFAAVTIADFLNLLYRAAVGLGERLEDRRLPDGAPVAAGPQPPRRAYPGRAGVAPRARAG